MSEDVCYDPYLRKLGVPGFRPGQEQAVASILRGHNTLVLMPTGAGKSLCYQLPALMLPGTALVVSPLLALMREQVEHLRNKGIGAFRLDSSLSPAEREEVKKDLREGRVSLLYVSPETLQGTEMTELFPFVKWSLFVIDEAHCLSEWGQRFRPDYLSLPRLARQWKCPVLALTATATEKVVDELCVSFHIQPGNLVRFPLRKPNIIRQVIPAKEDDKRKILLSILLQGAHRPAIVYVNKRDDAENIGSFLTGSGLSARAYHAGMNTESRGELQTLFLNDKIDILVATTAFGMGVDKPNVRSVVHYHIPAGMEGYLQESGRAGRDGKAAYSFMLGCRDDLTSLKNRIMATIPARTSLDSFLRGFLSKSSGNGEKVFSYWEATTTYDLHDTVVGRLLAFLEENSYFQWIGTARKNWKVRALVSPDRLLHGRGETEKRWMSWLLEKKDFVIEEAASYLGKGYRESFALLEDLPFSGEWKVDSSHQLGIYRQIKEVDSYATLAGVLLRIFEKRLERDLQRLDEMILFMEGSCCHNRQLESYFGELPQPSCGTCSFCENGQTALPPATPEPELTLEDMEFIRELAAQSHPALRNPHKMAAFLAGYLSPAASRARLWRLPQYGAYSRFSIDTLRYYTDTLL